MHDEGHDVVHRPVLDFEIAGVGEGEPVDDVLVLPVVAVVDLVDVVAEVVEELDERVVAGAVAVVEDEVVDVLSF